MSVVETLKMFSEPVRMALQPLVAEDSPLFVKPPTSESVGAVASLAYVLGDTYAANSMSMEGPDITNDVLLATGDRMSDIPKEALDVLAAAANAGFREGGNF